MLDAEPEGSHMELGDFEFHPVIPRQFGVARQPWIERSIRWSSDVEDYQEITSRARVNAPVRAS